ncbi:ABC transporter substrate-binding protein [Aquibacillus koreensis]|uniref:ABC transporter substrate-binding protein n=1 Tax=Aquibacillus koreensis TaxID=279446 RepID=A0A9X3WL84_9BACI|nr:ABC transporter substrate-binding protein [Aquibacillus koreensis]MCT2536483.1 ABC transporter substrate-binding protein [Aquibacillus koreensis]MDC3419429.1 ABC transporter substrate-binding protein [Aquibacillus koreensis]
MNKGRWSKIVSFALVSVLLLLTACGEDSASGSADKPTVKIGYLPITHAVPLYVEEALAEEGFENFELELVKFGSWPDLMDALNTGRIDGASALVTVAMRAKEQGIDLKAVALGHRDGNALVTANDIEGIADLEGKTFAIPHKFSTHNILLYQALKQNGFDYEYVNAVEMPPAEMPAALSEGRIAGYVVAEPFGAQSVVHGNGKVLYQEDDLWQNAIDCALVLRSEFIESEQEAAEEFVDAYVAAGLEADAGHEETHAIIQDYLDVDDEVLDLSLEWISYDDLKINEDSYTELREYIIEMGLSENPPTYDDFVDNSLIDKAM